MVMTVYRCAFLSDSAGHPSSCDLCHPAPTQPACLCAGRAGSPSDGWPTCPPDGLLHVQALISTDCLWCMVSKTISVMLPGVMCLRRLCLAGWCPTWWVEENGTKLGHGSICVWESSWESPSLDLDGLVSKAKVLRAPGLLQLRFRLGYMIIVTSTVDGNNVHAY